MSKEKDILLAERIATEVKKRGGISYYVGGLVRDKLLGLEGKDVDIEIHGITSKTLESILGDIGEWFVKGASFGVYGIYGSDIDIAMPRTEKQIGSGHKDFVIDVDPFVGEAKAALRRDITINSILENVLTHEIVDCYGGREDLKNRVIRCVNEKTFIEDQLRVLRVAQFASRFEFDIDESLTRLCKSMSLDSLPKERVFEELKKGLLKSKRPSIFFNTLRKFDQLDIWFPEMKKLIGLMQNAKFHAEGDVWNHTMMVLDESSKYRDLVSNPVGFMITAMMHDYGKIVSSFEKDGVIHSYNHEIEGLPVVAKALSRLTNDKNLEKYVLNMVKLHMKPNIVAGTNSKIKTTNKMYYDSIAPMDLIYLSCADNDGRFKNEGEGNNFKFLVERLDVYNEMMSRPYVTGDDLVNNGILPGKDFGKVMDFATKLRLAGISKEVALHETLSFAKKMHRQ